MAGKRKTQRFEVVASPLSDSSEAGNASTEANPIALHTKQYQLALDVFEEIGQSSVSINDAAQEISFLKSKQLIDVSDLSLLSKKALNVCHFLAAGMGDQELYDVDLGFFRWMIKYSSRNLDHLRRSLRECQKSAAQVLTTNPETKEETWVSVPLLGAAGIGNGKVRFRLDPGLRRELKSPRAKAFISMRVQVMFSTLYALNLYEKMCEVPRPCYSEWMTLEEFRIAMNINDIATMHEYKEFRRHFLEKSIKQINAHSELLLAYETEARGRGKTITHIRFHITDNPKFQHRSVLEEYREEQKARYEILTQEFGLSDKELEQVLELTGEHGDERIDEAIEITRFRMNTSNVPYPGMFLMKAIKDGMRLAARDRAKLKDIVDGPGKQRSLLTESTKSGNQQIKATADKYETLSKDVDAADLSEYWRAWSISLPGETQLKLAKVTGAMQTSLENESVRSGFCVYLEKQLKKPAKAMA